jgi:thiol-disulfide isomerase/thioredoxin
MRKHRLLLIAAGVLAVLPCVYAQAGPQSAAHAAALQNPAQASALTQAAAPGATVMGPPAPPSLAEVARLARASAAAKSPGAKPYRVINDDTMGRALAAAGSSAISVVGGNYKASGSSQGLVLLDFWATWCGPCRDALPNLKQFQQAYGDHVQVISVSEDRDEHAWSEFVSQNGMNWEQRLDSDHAIARKYQVSAYPTYILVGGDGTVLERLLGDDSSVPLASRMGAALQSPAPGSAQP